MKLNANSESGFSFLNKYNGPGNRIKALIMSLSKTNSEESKDCSRYLYNNFYLPTFWISYKYYELLTLLCYSY